MRNAKNGGLAILEQETLESVNEVRDQLFGHLYRHIADVDIRMDHMSHTSAIVCQVTVRMANHLLVLTRHRDLDALNAAKMALRRAKLQVIRNMRQNHKRRISGLSTAVS